MKHIKKYGDDEFQSFDAKSLDQSEEKTTIKTSVEDTEKVEKEFKKELDKIHTFESFVGVILQVDVENNDESGCGCCSNCSGLQGCDCGCEDCKCDEVEDYCDSCDRVASQCVCEPSDELNYHLSGEIPVTESVFRPGSKKFYSVIKEARVLFELGKINLCQIDRELYESTDIGKFAMFNGELVPLDLPMENIVELNEAKYHNKEVKLNYPMRSSGPKKYKVYVKNPKTGKVICVNFGDVKGGLTAKVSNPEARKSFAARHQCHLKKDKTKAGYWSCRLNKYGHLFGGRTYPGFW